MKRIMIVGCCGAGKSTISRQLQAKLGLKLIHLDQEYWKPNWIETEKEIWHQKMETLVTGDSWIIDGNYGGSMPIRLAKADTVIFLDRSRWLCLYRVIKRTILNYGRTRKDMTEGCPERFFPIAIGINFLLYVFHYNDVKRPQLLKRLKKSEGQFTVHTLKSDRAVNNFLANIKTKKMESSI